MESVIMFLKTQFVPIVFTILSTVFMYMVKVFADRVGKFIAEKMNAVLDKSIDDLKSKTTSEAVKAGLEEAREVARPIIVKLATTLTKELKDAVADNRVTKEDAVEGFKSIAITARAEVHAALADWKIRMKPILSDPDAILDSIVEEMYQVVKRNFELGSSKRG